MKPIEELLRKELRTERKLDPKKDVVLLGEGSIEHAVAKDLLEKIFNGRVKIVSVTKTTKRANVFFPTTLERELAQGLRDFLEDADTKLAAPPIMHTIPEATVLAYAKKNGLEGTVAERDDVRALLELLQARQPQTKAALRKSFDALGKEGKKFTRQDPRADG